ncbi:MAG TPA: hypothetical protein VL528_01275 [Oxalicibacterium sp.]|nr:hypothetical protein [Oxalicibacterium sp.]
MSEDRIDLRAILWVAVVLIVTLVLVGAAAYWLWSDQLPAPWRDEPNTKLDFKTEGPLLDSAPQPGRAAYEKEKQRLLDSWQWIDRDAGIARIPIEQAMALLAQQQASKTGQASAQRRSP